jgi:hypothetical protein
MAATPKLIYLGRLDTISRWNGYSFDFVIDLNIPNNFTSGAGYNYNASLVIDCYVKDIDTGQFLYDAAGKKLGYTWQYYDSTTVSGLKLIKAIKDSSQSIHSVIYDITHPPIAPIAPVPDKIPDDVTDKKLTTAALATKTAATKKWIYIGIGIAVVAAVVVTVVIVLKNKKKAI